jgi:hypothetical protein
MSTRTQNRVKVAGKAKTTGAKSTTRKAPAKSKTKTATQKSVTLHFDREKETPGTIRFKERPARKDDDKSVSVGTLYVKKDSDALLGSPDVLKVTIEVA